jgi:hypothetical protein
MRRKQKRRESDWRKKLRKREYVIITKQSKNVFV